MNAEHRRPVVAFVMLAFVAVAVIGFQRFEANEGRLLAAALGAGVEVSGTVPAVDAEQRAFAEERVKTLGPAFAAFSGSSHTVSIIAEPVVATTPTSATPRPASRAPEPTGTVPRKAPAPAKTARSAPPSGSKASPTSPVPTIPVPTSPVPPTTRKNHARTVAPDNETTGASGSRVLNRADRAQLREQRAERRAARAARAARTVDRRVERATERAGHGL